jgi:hypothetical protein
MPTRLGTEYTINNMTPEEVFDAINIQLVQHDNAQVAERILLRQEITENTLLVNRLVQTVDRWLGTSQPTPAGTPAPALASRLFARFSTSATPGPTASSTPPPTTTPDVDSTATPRQSLIPPIFHIGFQRHSASHSIVTHI